MSNYNKRSIDVKDLTKEPGATGILSDYQDHTDPKYIGPGTWNVIHRRAFKARDHKQQIIFIEEMKEICYGFPCLVCKGHCSEYIKNHPMEEYLDVLVNINGEKIGIGLFVWTWKFHNAVNSRIKKPIMSWDTVYNLYSESKNLVCSKNCLETEDSPPDGLEHSDQKTDTFSSQGDLVPNTPEFKQLPLKPQTRVSKITQNNSLMKNQTANLPTKLSQPFHLISVNRT
jgi:hypothetical protein